LILTAWLTARRGDRQTSRLDWVFLVIPLVLGVRVWNSGIQALRHHEDLPGGVPVGMHPFMGTVALLAATGDARMLLGGGAPGARRIARQLWRMCFGLFIAAGSFFLGPNNRPRRLLSAVGLGPHIAPTFFRLGLYLILTLLPLVLLVFWPVRIRFPNADPRQAQGSSA
jgi:hypothetical protein